MLDVQSGPASTVKSEVRFDLSGFQKSTWPTKIGIQAAVVPMHTGCVWKSHVGNGIDPDLTQNAGCQRWVEDNSIDLRSNAGFWFRLLAYFTRKHSLGVNLSKLLTVGCLNGHAPLRTFMIDHTRLGSSTGTASMLKPERRKTQ
jgi:hypothetical protein